MRIRYTLRAKGDLAAIFDYISTRNPVAGHVVKRRIVQTIKLLGDFPEFGWERPILEVRALGVAGYRYTVYYRFEDNEVWLIHIRDDRRRPLERGDL